MQDIEWKHSILKYIFSKLNPYPSFVSLFRSKLLSGPNSFPDRTPFLTAISYPDRTPWQFYRKANWAPFLSDQIIFAIILDYFWQISAFTSIYNRKKNSREQLNSWTAEQKLNSLTKQLNNWTAEQNSWTSEQNSWIAEQLNRTAEQKSLAVNSWTAFQYCCPVFLPLSPFSTSSSLPTLPWLRREYLTHGAINSGNNSY